uniref:NADH-ubiquinone oxidoreductase chain 3 n=1 Tax=Bostrichoidea sp. 6 KM-2017 TaxID=2219280 RepID=A0A346RKE9_9COLE|nr:NADH dehydrogenase subunit 3 [Bostrichoidea sp. 6 KM-2017]
MLLMTITTITLLILSMALMIMNYLISNNMNNREKASPFECGFDPKSSSRMPFSIHFFLIAIIFLVFDVEITLIFPMIISLNMSNILMYNLIFSTFLIILLIGTYHEMNQGMLNWTH